MRLFRVLVVGLLLCVPVAAQTPGQPPVTAELIGCPDLPSLTGDATTTAGSCATTVSKIQGTAISGVSGTGNVVLSASPTFTGTVTTAAITTPGQITSTATTGTAPLVIASTTNVPNLNASSLAGATFAAPGTIGGGTPGGATFTNLTANTSLTVNGGAILPILSATSGSIGGGALLVGQCTSGTTTVTGATTSMVAQISPNTYPGDGTVWDAQVTSSNTVTIKVCAIVALTPNASTYNVRVLQ